MKFNPYDIIVCNEQDVGGIIDSNEESTKVFVHGGIRDIPTEDVRLATKDESALFWYFGPVPKMLVDTMSREDLDKIKVDVQKAFKETYMGGRK